MDEVVVVMGTIGDTMNFLPQPEPNPDSLG